MSSNTFPPLKRCVTKEVTSPPQDEEAFCWVQTPFLLMVKLGHDVRKRPVTGSSPRPPTRAASVDYYSSFIHSANRTEEFSV